MSTDRPRIRERMMQLGLDVSRGEYEDLVFDIRSRWRRLPHARRKDIKAFTDRAVAKFIKDRINGSV